MFKAMVNDDYEIPLSVGVIEGDKVIVKEGPLSGMEGLIKKIDRHKRVAVLNAQMFEQDVDIRIGLEIIEKYKK
jgi:transcriptional antiterminator NusG